ncbi:MAG: hypothetical protein WBP42_02450 [Candidatus Zixiibacteriota bacterium]
MRIEFIIPGPLGFDHRRIESWKNGRRTVFLENDYKAFRQRARRALAEARRQSGWIVPDVKTPITMYLEYHVASHQITKRKKFADKNGRPLKAQTRTRALLDEDNLKKGVKDSLQRDRKTKKNPVVDTRYLYINDNVVNAYPFPGHEWFVTEPGFAEWIVVALEVVGEFQPHVEQSKLQLEDKF